MASGGLVIDVVQLINKLALGDPAQIATVVGQWAALGDVLDQRTGGSGSTGSDSVMGVTGQLTSWTGPAANEFRTQSGVISDYGRLLATAVGDTSTKSDTSANSMASAMTAIQSKLQAAQKVATQLDAVFMPLSSLGWIVSYIQKLADPNVLRTAPVTQSMSLPTGATVQVYVPANVIPESSYSPQTTLNAPGTVTVLMPKGTGADSSLGSMTTTPQAVTEVWLYPRVNEPLRAPATKALATLTSDYNLIVAGLPATPDGTKLPTKYDGSQGSIGTVGPTGSYSPGVTSPALNANQGLGNQGVSANNQGASNQGVSANNQGGANQGLTNQGTGTNAQTSLAGYNTPTVSTPTLSTPTGTSGLGTTGLGTTGVGTTDPLTSLGVSTPTGTSLSGTSPYALTPGYYAMGAGGLGGTGTDLTGTGKNTTNGSGLSEAETGTTAEALQGEAATTAATRSSMPPMYPPMMPPGMGQGNRDRTRGTYLPEDDIWTEDLVTVPGVITGA